MKKRDHLTGVRDKKIADLFKERLFLTKNVQVVTEEKDVHSSRKKRKDLARILTVIAEKEIIAHES